MNISASKVSDNSQRVRGKSMAKTILDGIDEDAEARAIAEAEAESPPGGSCRMTRW